MKVSLLFVFIHFVGLSQQQHRQNQNAVHSLSYSPSDFDSQSVVTPSTTTTTTIESTTKKKGFFSGIAGFFKGGSKESSTTTTIASTITSTTTRKPSTITTQLTSTVKVVIPSQTTTTTTIQPIKHIPTPPNQKSPSQDIFPALPTQSNRPQTQPTPTTQRVQTSSTRSTLKDNFPPLPTQPGRPQALPQQPIGPPVPNAWNVRPQIQTDKPATFFSQGSTTTTTTTTRRPAQSPSNGNHGAASQPKVTDAELLTLSDALFSKDTSNPFKFVTVNYQGRTQSSATTDEAPQPLLQIDEKLYAMSTVEKMKLMFNNYEQDTSINEYVTPIERKEENDFIDAVLQTSVMRHAMSFLQQKGVVTADPATHKELLKTLWFGMYSRGQGKISSSGFEHVFLSEIKNGTVLGLHNWIYLAEEESARDLDYKGWLKKIDLGNKGQIAKVRFSLNGINKPSNSLFIGTSPELELALYTVCFELRADQECRLAYGGKDFNIVTHTFRYRGKNLIGSAYPEI